MRMKTIIASFFVALVFAGCGGTVRRGEPVRLVASVDNANEERGHVVYDQRCSQCHPGGEGGFGPSLNEKPLPAFLMRLQVRQGIGAMPGFSEAQISEPDLDALIEYIFALRHPRTLEG